MHCDPAAAPTNGVLSSPVIEYSTMYNGHWGGGGGGGGGGTGDLGSVAKCHTICVIA